MVDSMANGIIKTTANMISNFLYDCSKIENETETSSNLSLPTSPPNLGTKMNISERHVFPIAESLRLESVSNNLQLFIYHYQLFVLSQFL